MATCCPGCSSSSRHRLGREAGLRDFNKTYGDYCLLYSALAGKDAAAKALATAPSVADHIDDGSSMSYLLAYLMTHQG